MTIDRFLEYVKTAAGAAAIEHLFINRLVFDLAGFGYLTQHPLPIALPLATLAGLWGCWAVYHSAAPLESPLHRCPSCGSQVTELKVPRAP